MYISIQKKKKIRKRSRIIAGTSVTSPSKNPVGALDSYSCSGQPATDFTLESFVHAFCTSLWPPCPSSNYTD